MIGWAGRENIGLEFGAPFAPDQILETYVIRSVCNANRALSFSQNVGGFHFE